MHKNYNTVAVKLLYNITKYNSIVVYDLYRVYIQTSVSFLFDPKGSRPGGSLASACISVLTTRDCFTGRFHPFIDHEGPWGEQRYSSTLFLTVALEGGEGSALHPGRTLPLGKTRYPLYRRLGGPQGRSGQVRKISPPPGFFFCPCLSIPGPSSP
jgi:hypothetical protein